MVMVDTNWAIYRMMTALVCCSDQHFSSCHKKPMATAHCAATAKERSSTFNCMSYIASSSMTRAFMDDFTLLLNNVANDLNETIII